MSGTSDSSLRPYFQAADWLWDSIPNNPVLDPQSSEMVSWLHQSSHVCNFWRYGVTLRGPEKFSDSTPRHDIVFALEAKRGYDPFGSDTMPIPTGTPIPPGTDRHVAIADLTTNQSYNLWEATLKDRVWGASWGSKTPLDGDGLEMPSQGSSTGSNLARFAAVVRVAEIAQGVIPHALFFATNMAAPDPNFRYPAQKTDGSNTAGAPAPIPEGARVQLDPTIDVDAIPNITPFEKIVARALQVYGAYCGDNGPGRMIFLFEFEGGTEPGDTYVKAGAPWDGFDMQHIPWDRLRVLKSWNGR